MVTLPVTGRRPAGDDVPLTLEQARARLGNALGYQVLPEGTDPDAPDVDGAMADRLLGMNGCLVVSGREQRPAVLFADHPNPMAVQHATARLGVDFTWAVGATPDVFPRQFARARARRTAADGFIERVLDVALYLGASDVKVAPGDLPGVKMAGTTWRRLGEFPPVTPAQARQAAAWAARCAPDDLREGPFDLDTSATYGGVRLRANVYRTLRHWGLTLRILPLGVPAIESLGLPDAVIGLCALERGLVFVSGPTGSGKTTTLAAMLDRINRTRAVAIATMELPVEYLHRPRRALIHAREVESDTVSFARAIDSALRQNPDVILVGELRNPEEYLAALRLARTGHLVFATLHADTAEEAVRGVVHSFPEGDQQLVRTELAATLRAVIVQTLVPRRANPQRSTAVCEVLLRTTAVAAIIARGAFPQLVGEIRGGRRLGMCCMDDALAEAVERGVVEFAAAAHRARDPEQFVRRMGGRP